MSSFTCPKCSKCRCECGVLPLTAQVTITGLQPRSETNVEIWTNRIFFFDVEGQRYPQIEAYATSPGGCLGAMPGFSCEEDSPAYCPPGQDDRGPVDGVMLLDGGGCFALVARSEPDITLSATPRGIDGDDGESVPSKAAKFTPIFKIGYEEFGTRKDIPFWSISGVTIEGGSGYRGDENITVSLSRRALPPEDRPIEDSRGTIEIEPASLTVIANEIGTPTGVEINYGGRYYKERIDLPGYTFPLAGKVFLDSFFPEEDSGARIIPVVDTVATSDTFGEATSLLIDDGGDGILAYRYSQQTAHILDGQPLLMRATQTKRLVSFEADACFGSGVCVMAEPVDVRSEPQLQFEAEGICIPSANLFNAGCGGSFSPVTKVTYEDDDPTRPVWSLESIGASGGRLYGSGPGGTTALGMVRLFDSITGMPLDYAAGGYCDVVGTLPTFYCDVDPPIDLGAPGNPDAVPPIPPTPRSGGVLAGATVADPGAFWRERKYMGELVPIQRVTVAKRGFGYAELGRIPPTLSLAVVPNYGVTLAPTLGTEKDDCGRDYWFIESVAVSGGSGYQSAPLVFINAAEGDTTAQAAEIRLGINENGIPTVATVTNPGRYWRSTKDAQPYVATLTSRCIQLPPSKGEGAEISFDVDSDPHSPSFGQVTKAHIVNGGSGYITLGQEGCTYESSCNVLSLSLSRDKISLHGNVYSGLFATPLYIRMAAPGLAVDGCTAGSASLSPLAGNGTGASVIWPAPEGDVCDSVPCYCRCPGTLQGLCITVEWTAPSGRTYTRNTNDPQSDGTLWHFSDKQPHPEFGFDMEIASATLTISCDRGWLYMTGFGALYYDLIEGCYCTTAQGCTGRFCDTGHWWDGSYSIEMEWDEWSPGSCSGCPNPGSFSVTISTPTEVTDQPC